MDRGMSLTWGRVLIFTLMTVGLAACNYPQPVPTDSLCNPDSMLPPELSAPFDGEMLEILQPFFSWTNPNNCQLESFQILVGENPDMELVIFGEVDSPIASWQPSQPLHPGFQYWWRVYPNIASAPREDGGVDYELGPPSEIRTFFTGPMCNAGDELAPSLVEPNEQTLVAPRETVSTQLPVFVWTNTSGCLPDWYQLIISEQPNAYPPILIDYYSEDASTRWQLNVDLEENTQYFWKVRPFVDGMPGPFSEVRSFRTGSIDEDQPGVISGQVWNDACDNPLPRDSYVDPLPDGCVEEGGLVMANGVKDVGEGGIADVEVMIGDGECPISETPLFVDTDELGFYYQFLPEGIYCVEVAETSTKNQDRLMSGIWTHPAPGGEAQQSVQIALPGQIRENVNFGWDYDGEYSGNPGSVSGKVWNDLNGDGVLDEDEPGIEGLELWLFKGDCDESLPTSDDRVVNAMRTDEQGRYGYDSNGQEADAALWSGLDPGAYCVMVDPGDHEFQYILSLGSWTSPLFGDALPAIRFSLMPGEERSDIHFGWHYPPYLIADVNANCRSGPGVIYPSLFPISQGSMHWILGHNPSTTWLGIEHHLNSSCWVSDSVVTVYGDPTESTLWPIPPTPEPPDTSPPSLGVTHTPPVPDVSDSVIFTATASDDRGVARIVIRVKPSGSSSFSIEKECTNATKCTYGGGPYNRGIVEYYAEAWDEAGNKRTSGTQIFTVEDPYL